MTALAEPPVDRPARAEGWAVVDAAFAHARSRGRRWLTYGEWDRVFEELRLKTTPMLPLVWRALSVRKWHVDAARDAGETAEAEAAAWRRETIAPRWKSRRERRARAIEAASRRKRGGR